MEGMWSSEGPEDTKGFDLLTRRSNEYIQVRKILERLVMSLPKSGTLLESGTLLDVGAGNPATITDRISKHFKETKIIEPNPAYRLQHENRGNEVIGETLEKANFDPDTYDFIVCSQIFYYIPVNQWKDMAQEMKDALKEDGALAVILHSKESTTYKLMCEMYGGELPVSIEHMQEHINFETEMYPYEGLISLENQSELATLLEFLRRSLPSDSQNKQVNVSDLQIDNIDNSGAVMLIRNN